MKKTKITDLRSRVLVFGLFCMETGVTCETSIIGNVSFKIPYGFVVVVVDIIVAADDDSGDESLDNEISYSDDI